MTAAKTPTTRTTCTISTTTRPALHPSVFPLVTTKPNLHTKANGADRRQIQAVQLKKQSPLQLVAQLAKQLAETENIDSDTALSFCNLLKSVADDIESAAWGEGQQSMLESLRVSLPALLPALSMTINTGVYTSKDLEQIAYGLGALAGESRGLFHDGQVLMVDPAPFRAACQALLGKCASGQITFASSNGSTLAILNLMSRGLKRGLLDSGDSLIRAAYAEALVSINLEPGLTTEQTLDDRQCGKWLVQLSAIATYNLLDAPTDPSEADSRLALSGAARAFLVNADVMLVQARQRKKSPSGVIVQNHIDAARNLANHGVLNIKQNSDLQSMATLLKLIGTLDLDTLRGNFGRTMASVTNFLLFLEQQSASTLPEISGDFRKTSDKVLAALSCFTPIDAANVGANALADLLHYIDMGPDHKPDDARLAGVSTILITALGQLPQREIRQAKVAANLMSCVENLRKKGIAGPNTAVVNIKLADAICLASDHTVSDLLCGIATMKSLAASPPSDQSSQGALRNIERLLLKLPANKTLNDADKLVCLRGLALLVPLSSGAQWSTVVELFATIMGKKAADKQLLDSLLNKEIQRLQKLLGTDSQVDPAPVATKNPVPQPSQIVASASAAQLTPIERKQDPKQKKSTKASKAPPPNLKENKAPQAKPGIAVASRQTAPTKARVESPAQQRALWFDLLQDGNGKDLTSKLANLLSQQPALLNATLDKKGMRTPMVLAVANGHKDVVTWLWKKSSQQVALGPGLIDAILTSTTIVDPSVAEALDTLLNEISARFNLDGLAKLKGFKKELLAGFRLLPEVLKKHGLITDLPTVVTVAKVATAKTAPPAALPLADARRGHGIEVGVALDAALESIQRDSLQIIEALESRLLIRGLRSKAIGWDPDETRAAVTNRDPSQLWQMLVGDDGYLKQDNLDQAAAAAIMAAKKSPLRLREILALQRGKELLDHALISGETIRHFLQDVAQNQRRPEVGQAIINADIAAEKKQANALV